MATFAAGAAAPQPATAQISAADAVAAVKIVRCEVLAPPPFSRRASGTRIVWVNAGPTILHIVSFVIGYRVAGGAVERSVDDVGLFAPGTRIDHRFDTFKDVQFGGAKTSSCRVSGVR